MNTLHLILIKHSAPEVQEDVPSPLWQLSGVGRERCGVLAERVGKYQLAKIFTSEEPKALETGKLLGEKLGVAVSSRDGLQEHDRSNVPHMRSREFISMMELAFRRSSELVLGAETVASAEKRFDAAIRLILKEHLAETVVVVSHGTVLAQWLGVHMEKSPFEIWRKMGLPSLVVLTRPGFEVVEVCTAV